MCPVHGVSSSLPQRRHSTSDNLPVCLIILIDRQQLCTSTHTHTVFSCCQCQARHTHKSVLLLLPFLLSLALTFLADNSCASIFFSLLSFCPFPSLPVALRMSANWPPTCAQLWPTWCEDKTCLDFSTEEVPLQFSPVNSVSLLRQTCPLGQYTRCVLLSCTLYPIFGQV